MPTQPSLRKRFRLQADYSIWVKLDLVRYWKESTAYKNAVHLFPKEFEEQMAKFTYTLSSTTF